MKRKALEVERGRWSAKAKREVVLRLLRGEDLDALSVYKPKGITRYGWRKQQEQRVLLQA